MAVPGVFASDWSMVGDPKGDYASALLQIWPTGNAPLFALSSGMEQMAASSTIVHWFEEIKLSGASKVTDIHGAAQGTTITVDDGSFYVPGVLLLNQDTQEYLLVSAITDNQMTVIRGIGGSTITDVAVGHDLQRIGTGHEEGSDMPEAVQNIGDIRFNVVQIFRNVWSVTGTATAVQYHTGSKVAKGKADCGLFHAEDIETSMIWGIKHIAKQNGYPLRFSDGLRRQLQKHGGHNRTATGGNVKWTELRDWIYDLKRFNVKGKPNERLMFCGDTWLKVFDDIGRINGVIQVFTSETAFGMEIKEVRTAVGKLTAVVHPKFNESTVWRNDALVIHPGAVRSMYLRKTFIENYDLKGQRISGKDSDVGVYTTEVGWQYMAAQTGGYYSGAQRGIAES